MSELTADQSVPSKQPLKLVEVIVRSWQEGWKAWPWLLPLGATMSASSALTDYWMAVSGGPTADFSRTDCFTLAMMLTAFPLTVCVTNASLKWVSGESVRFTALWQGWRTISLLLLLLFLFLMLLGLPFAMLTEMTGVAEEPLLSMGAWLVMGGVMAFLGLSAYCAAHQNLGVRQSLRQAFALGRGARGSLLILGLLGAASFPSAALQWLGVARFVGEFVCGTLLFPFQVMLFAVVYFQRIQASEGESA